MDFDRELRNIADLYTNEGYRVTLHPGPEDLPPFAKDFQVEMAARRGTSGVLVQVKRDREEMAADGNMPRYAEVASAQPGWRLDLVILQPENPRARELRGAEEPKEDYVASLLASAEALGEQGHLNPALVTAWAGLESVMRRRLRAAGEPVGLGTNPRGMLSELYSTGTFSADEFPELEKAWGLRNKIAHGFFVPPVEEELVRVLIDAARRVLADTSQPVPTP